VEVGFADFAIEVVGIMSAWYSGHFWLAVIVVISVFLLCDAIGHIVRSRSFAPGNAGFAFWWDLLLPALLITLYAAQ
jgi:hypothetical protein